MNREEATAVFERLSRVERQTAYISAVVRHAVATGAASFVAYLVRDWPWWAGMVIWLAVFFVIAALLMREYDRI